MSLFVITAKTLFLNNLLISLYCKSIKRVFCIRTDISAGGNYFMDIPAEIR